MMTSIAPLTPSIGIDVLADILPNELYLKFSIQIWTPHATYLNFETGEAQHFRKGNKHLKPQGCLRQHLRSIVGLQGNSEYKKSFCAKAVVN